MDWAHDDVIADTIDLLEVADVPATWFVTHNTPILARLRRNPKFELGIHPNFNKLLTGNSSSSAQDIVERLMNIVPEAKSIRCHSMTQSSGLLDIFVAAGLTHDVNHFIPVSVGTELRPWVLWNDLIRIPYFWEDDIACICESKGREEPSVKDAAKTGNGIKVFDFHPIHIFLNTENLQRYEQTRNIHQNPQALIQHRFPGAGVRTKLLDLLNALKADSLNRTIN